MKIFQIVEGFCHWDASDQINSLAEVHSKFPSHLLFVEAPDYVFEGWGYLDGEFIKPTPPDGWLYDDRTGTFYKSGTEPPQPEPTETELLGRQLTDLQLDQIEQGQFATELQLQMMEANANV